MSKEKKTVTFDTIVSSITEMIKSSANGNAVDSIVKKRFDAEVARRADILDKAVDKYAEAKKLFSKAGPDLKTHDVISGPEKGEFGEPVTRMSYSDAQLKYRKALQKYIAEMDLAISKAIEENDYQKLQELSNATLPKSGSKTE
jgi:hypothetical protein